MNTPSDPQARDGTAGIVLPGRFLLPDRSEHHCRVTAISPEGALFLTPLEIAPGVRMVCYIDELGRIEATTGERTGGSLHVRFHPPGLRPEKLAQLSALPARSTSARRRHERFSPDGGQAQLILDGRPHPCEILDISLSGAALRTAVVPAIGSYVQIGKTAGRVVRLLENGLAIEFVKPLDLTKSL